MEGKGIVNDGVRDGRNRQEYGGRGHEGDIFKNRVDGSKEKENVKIKKEGKGI